MSRQTWYEQLSVEREALLRLEREPLVSPGRERCKLEHGWLLALVGVVRRLLRAAYESGSHRHSASLRNLSKRLERDPGYLPNPLYLLNVAQTCRDLGWSDHAYTLEEIAARIVLARSAPSRRSGQKQGMPVVGHPTTFPPAPTEGA